MSFRQIINLLIVFFLCNTSSILAQDIENEFQTRTSVKLSYSPIKKMKVSISPEVRMDENFTLDKFLAEGEVEYKISKLIRVAGTYRYVVNQRNTKPTEYLHQYAANLKLKKKFGRFEPSLRIRYANYADDDIQDKAFMRYKLKLEYDIAKTSLQPFIGAEIFRQVSDDGNNKMRYSVGVNYKLMKKNYIGVSYKLDYYQQEYKNRHIISVNYHFKF